MSGAAVRPVRLERMLAGVLGYGTWLASAVVASGIALALTGSRVGVRAMSMGIAFFILLPVLRVVLMLLYFWRERDYRFGVIAGVVLMVIGLGCALGRL
jgi:uncharacterized membrane protein